MPDGNERVGPAPIPVTVLAGFLGAGKTTLLNHILSGDHGRRIACVVNDFGSINIDAELVSDVGEGMVSLANGCICCVVRSDLVSAVLKLADGPRRPDHIVIESSGVAIPESVVRAFQDPEIWKHVVLDGIVTVVDAENFPGLPDEEARLAMKQVSDGDLIVLNKIDRVNSDERARLRDRLREIRPGAAVLEAQHGDVPTEILLGIGAAGPAPIAHDESVPHDHGVAFDTWTFESEVPLDLPSLQQLVGHLPSAVYRIKGFVYADKWRHRRLLLHRVGRRTTIAVTGPWDDDEPRTRLVFIAKRGTCDAEKIRAALRSCERGS